MFDQPLPPRILLRMLRFHVTSPYVLLWRTIEVADAIYGVSMGRDGVSKVLSLRLADLPQN